MNSSLNKELVFALLTLFSCLSGVIYNEVFSVQFRRALKICSNKIWFALGKSRSNALQFMSWVTKIRKENS